MRLPLWTWLDLTKYFMAKYNFFVIYNGFKNFLFGAFLVIFNQLIFT